MAFNTRMHERNIYKIRPDFANLALEYPEFRKHVYPDVKGKYHVDFTNTETLRVLTQILLRKDFNLFVEIPHGFLVPTVPQRLNYILWVEDLLNVTSQRSSDVYGIDVGTGPCAIFSLLGARKNNWRFVATESSDDAIRWANKNIQANDMQDNIQIVKVDKNSILKEVLSSTDKNFNFCLCNPPFFDNIEEIRRKNVRLKETIADVAKKEEIFAEGGEIAFVRNMIEDSQFYKNRVSLYTSMFGKKKSFIQIRDELKNIPDIKITSYEFCQGNTVRWGIAWTFEQSFEFPKMEKVKSKAKVKPKRPLVYHVPATIHNPDIIVPPILKRVIAIMEELKVPVTIHRSSKNFAEVQIKALKNTWSHQRRKRREISRKHIQLTEDETVESKSMENVAIASEISHCDAKDCTAGQMLDANLMGKINILDSKIKLKVEGLNSNLKNDSESSCAMHSDSVTAVPTTPLKNSCIMSETVGSNLLHENQNVTSLIEKSKCNEDEGVQKPVANAYVDEMPKVMLQNLMNKRKRENSLMQHEEREIKKIHTSEEFENNDSKSFISNEAKKVEKGDIETLIRNEAEFKNSSIDTASVANVAEECTALLDSIIRVRKAKNCILLEMTCVSDVYREPMHQIFQFIKNKLK